MTSSGKDYIPRSNALFNPWQLNFVAKVNLFKTGWGWPTETDDEWTLLTATADKKKIKYDKAWLKVSLGLFDSADEQRLKDARREYESSDKLNPEDTSIRMFVNRHLRFDPLVSNDQKIDIGLIVPDIINTPTSDSNAVISGNILAGKVRSMKHLIHYNVVSRVGVNTKAKGAGVDEIEVFIAFTAADIDKAPPLKDFQYDGEVKRGLYTRSFATDQEGLRAWYYSRLRIKGKKISFGPPSDIWGSVIP